MPLPPLLPDLFHIAVRLRGGAATTIETTVSVAALAFPFSILVGIARTSRLAVIRILSSIFVEVFRGTSAFVQLYYAYFVLPLLGLTLSPILTGVLVLSLNVTAYASEVVRAAIQAVDRGQWDAITALNMPRSVALRRIILPQTMIRVLPPFGNQVIELLKGTALLSAITISELTFQAQGMASTTGRPLRVFVVVMLLYLILALPFVFLSRWLERRATRYLGAPASS